MNSNCVKFLLVAKISNLAKLEFAALDIMGKNYMSWILDVELHLQSMGLIDTIKKTITPHCKIRSSL